jgi:hypothetical protein
MTGQIFDEEKPSKTIGEVLDKTKNAVVNFGGEIKNDINSIDTKAIKQKLGGFWRKITGKNEEQVPILDVAHDPEHQV